MSEAELINVQDPNARELIRRLAARVKDLEANTFRAFPDQDYLGANESFHLWPLTPPGIRLMGDISDRMDSPMSRG